MGLDDAGDRLLLDEMVVPAVDQHDIRRIAAVHAVDLLRPILDGLSADGAVVQAVSPVILHPGADHLDIKTGFEKALAQGKEIGDMMVASLGDGIPDPQDRYLRSSVGDRDTDGH